MAAPVLIEQQHFGLTMGAAARAAASHARSLSQMLPVAQQEAAIRARVLPPGVLTIAPGRAHFAPGSLLASTTPAAGDHLTARAPVDAPAPSTELRRPDFVSRVAAIRDLIRSEQISTARRMLGPLAVGAFEEAAMMRLRRALATPIVRSSARQDADRTRAYEWLRQRGHQHRGQWVAVGEDGLIAAAPTLKGLREQLRVLTPAQQPLIHKL